MNVTYFNRHTSIGFSIHKVFKPIIRETKKKLQVESYNMPAKNSMPWDILRNCVFTFKHRNRRGINHVTGHIHDVLLALIGLKTILTVHDLVFLDNIQNPFKRFYKWLFWFYLPIKIADRVVCISNQTKQNILNRLNTNKLTVIYNPLDPQFEFNPKAFNSKKPIILHIGTGWNKNLKRTIKAVEGIDCHLRIIGKLTADYLSELKKRNIDYSNEYGISDEAIKEEYIQCDIVNFPSEYEGFGMPIIEGQKTGRIVITSSIEPMIEVSGGAAFLVNPQSVTSIRKAYFEVIKNNELREKIIEKGLKNASRFCLDTISAQYINLYQSI